MANAHYPDAPRVAVGAVVVYQDKILLILRGKNPNKGLWAIPGGSMNLGETLQATAEREVREETGLTIKAGEVVFTFEAIHYDDAGRVEYHYVILDLVAEPLNPTQPLCPADDVVDAAWFATAELANLAVTPGTRELLNKFFATN